MSRTVIILGAGASAAAGAPLMNNFLQVSEDLLRRGEVLESQYAFELVLRGRALLGRSHSKSSAIDVHNLEDVFSAFEMARALRTLPGLEPHELERLPDSYRIVIGRTLDRTVNFSAQNFNLAGHDSYRNFALMIRDRFSPGEKPTVITFNYDLGLEIALNFIGEKIDYGLGDSLSPDTATYHNPPTIPVLKLHGSVNWAEAHLAGNKTGKIWVKTIPDLANQYQRYLQEYLGPSISSHKVEMTKMIYEQSSIGRNVRGVPAIVPPTFNKTQDNWLVPVWQRAAQALSYAENIIVIGYSLPQTDQFFRYLFSMGLIGEAVLRRFWVFDPDAAVEDRYRNLLGPMAKPKFKFFKQKFEDSISSISNAGN